MSAPSPSERWRRLEAIFNEALELDAGARSAFLDRACGDDQELRREAESLLDSAGHEDARITEFIEDAARDFYEVQNARRLEAGAVFGHYEIVRLIGAGGMGEVYLARDTRLGRNVALKTLHSTLLDDARSRGRFNQEARAASALNHPNILTIYEFGEQEGLYFIASEYIEGRTLREKLAGGALALDEAVEIATQIAAGLSAAHALGIVHRDVKPENVIVRGDGIVKVLDFGIAKLDDERSLRLKAMTIATQTGMVVGSAKYMSPEQARGIKVDSRTDIFSLGTVLFEMVVGRAPFEGDTHSDVVSEILKTDPAPLESGVPGAPRKIIDIIRKALSKEREKRYQNMGDLLDALRRFKEDLDYQEKKEQSLRRATLRPKGIREEIFQTEAPPAASATIPEGVPTHRRRLAVIAIAAVIVMCLGAFLLWRARQSVGAGEAHSLAILPFRNLRQDPATDFLGFSLADAVITKLGMVSALTVRPSSAVDQYRNKAIDPRKAGSELNVDTLLTGTFLKDGNDLRITTQLVDVKRDKLLWQDSIDVKYDKLLSVQDSVVRQIIKGLALSLSPAENDKLKLDSPTNSSAYELYLRGVDLYSLNDFASAITMLNKSAALDPDYALTWAQLGRAYTTNASLQFGGREAYAKAEAAYQKALMLNPALIEPRVYMANLFTDTGRVEQAVPLLRLALQDNRNSAEAHWELGYAYRFAGMLRESVKECERARQLDPRVKLNSSALNSYMYLGEYDKFLASLPANNSVYVLFYRGLGEYYKGDVQRALGDFQHAYSIDPSLLQAQVGEALADAILHRESDGIGLLNQTVKKIDERGVTDGEGIYKVAQAYAVLGDKASALRILGRSIDGGFFPYPYFRTDPLLDTLRGDTEFNQILDRALHRHQQFQAAFFSAQSVE